MAAVHSDAALGAAVDLACLTS